VRRADGIAPAVAGVGETGPVPVDERSIPEMALDAVEAALEDARLGLGDVDAVVTASVDLFDGLTASNVAVTEVVGAVMKPETRIAGDGLCAAIHGACELLAGACETVLVVAHAKASMAPHWALTEWAMDPVYLQPLGVDFLVCAGLQARVLAQGDAGAEARWAELVAERLADARGGAGAPAPSAEEVLASPPLAAPLRRGMAAPLADGACAVVLTSRSPAAREGPVVRVAGAGWDLDPHSLGERDLARWEGLRRACSRAYAAAGLDQADPGLELAEPSCLFAHEEELFREAAGVGTDVALSPTGGLFAGAVPVVAGLSRLVAAARALRAGAAGRALAHGTWGPAGQAHVVAVLEAGG